MSLSLGANISFLIDSTLHRIIDKHVPTCALLSPQTNDKHKVFVTMIEFAYYEQEFTLF